MEFDKKEVKTSRVAKEKWEKLKKFNPRAWHSIILKICAFELRKRWG
jgi:hypothetical protein